MLGKLEVLGKNPVPLPLCPPLDWRQTPISLVRAVREDETTRFCLELNVVSDIVLFILTEVFLT